MGICKGVGQGRRAEGSRYSPPLVVAAVVGYMLSAVVCYHVTWGCNHVIHHVTLACLLGCSHVVPAWHHVSFGYGHVIRDDCHVISGWNHVTTLAEFVHAGGHEFFDCLLVWEGFQVSPRSREIFGHTTTHQAIFGCVIFVDQEMTVDYQANCRRVIFCQAISGHVIDGGSGHVIFVGQVISGHATSAGDDYATAHAYYHRTEP